MRMQRFVFHFWVAAGLWLGVCRSSAQANAPSLRPVTLHAEATSTNPRDPFIFSDRKKYYLIGTALSGEGFQCYESTDLVGWKMDGWAWRVSGLRVAHRGLRAPRVFLYQGLYYLAYGAQIAGGARLGLAASSQPQGPYHDVHVPWVSIGEGCAGANVFVDHNGKALLTFCRSGSVYGAPLSQDLSNLIGPPVRFVRPEQKWELLGSSPGMDSSSMFRIGSKYYLTYSAGNPQTLEAGIGYATADKPLGPWVKSDANPLLSTRSESGLSSPTQGSIFHSVDSKGWFILYQTRQSVADVTGSINVENLELTGIRQLFVNPTSRRNLILK